MKRVEVHNDAGLQLNRFWNALEFKRVQSSTNGCSLIITNYLDDNLVNWLHVCRSDYEVLQPEERIVNGNSLAIGRQFFATQQQSFVEQTLNTLTLPMNPIPLNEARAAEWQWIVERILGNMECEYAFRKEFLQELVLQAVHFVLKHTSGNK